jgi:hypothetical protein
MRAADAERERKACEEVHPVVVRKATAEELAEADKAFERARARAAALLGGASGSSGGGASAAAQRPGPDVCTVGRAEDGASRRPQALNGP